MQPFEDRPRIDRRVALRWISSAAVSLPFLDADLDAANEEIAAASTTYSGYGPDPDLLKIYQPGDLWPLTFSAAQRQQVVVLCDLIIPTEDASPGATSVGVPDFIDEWISSPYPGQKSDRSLLLKGLKWLDEDAGRRGESAFVVLRHTQQVAICTELAVVAKTDRKAFPGTFFRRLRDLVAGGYYTTPEGMRDIGYRGNTPTTEWNGPPQEVLEKLGLSAQ